MSLAPAFLSLTNENRSSVTVALAHITAIQPQRMADGIAHIAECPETSNDPDRCDCPWRWGTGAALRLPDGVVVTVREAYDDILTLINARAGLVIDGAGIIARAYAQVAGDRTAGGAVA